MTPRNISREYLFGIVNTLDPEFFPRVLDEISEDHLVGSKKENEVV